MTKAVEIYAKATAHLQQLVRSERGQGTVEYVGILFIVAAICGAVLMVVPGTGGSSIGNMLIQAITQAIQNVMG
jgi:hypothetical protein